MDNLNMKVKDLKEILSLVSDDMDVIIPVITEEDANTILAFRHVRTAGILSTLTEEEPALCLNAAANGVDITTQINDYYKGDVKVEKLLW